MARPPYVSVHIRSQIPSKRIQAADIVRCITAEIGAGTLPHGSRLPPVRVLEHSLGLSKNTAQAAYDELVARGLLETREREGVFVAKSDDNASPAPQAPAPPQLRTKPAPLPARQPPRRDHIALSTVFIDPDLLPREKLAECVRSVLRGPALEPFYDWQGNPGLRRAIAARLRARGMDVEADHVIVTAGSQQALDLVARASTTRTVALEDPVYGHARMLFENQDKRIVPLQLDPFAGIDIATWRAQIAQEKPGLLYAITSYQNPTGYSYSTHELLSLLDICREHDVALLEDDWGSDMLSGTEYRPTLRAMGGPNVLYANSFTKKLLPSLRLGFLVAAPELIAPLVSQKRLATLGNPTLLEATLCEFLERGYYDTHLHALQRELDRRYAICLTTLEAQMPEGVRWTTPGGGPTLWLELPRSVNIDDLRAALLKEGVDIEVTSSSFMGKPHLHGIRISYAFLPEDRLARGLDALARALRQQLH